MLQAACSPPSSLARRLAALHRQDLLLALFVAVGHIQVRLEAAFTHLPHALVAGLVAWRQLHVKRLQTMRALQLDLLTGHRWASWRLTYIFEVNLGIFYFLFPD